MIPTSVTSPANTQSPSSAAIGIASLILEGRALSDDEFIILNETVTTAIIAGRSESRHGGTGSRNQKLSTLNLRQASGNIVSNPTKNNPATYRIDPSDSTLQHMQRLAQKLGQLRQSSPGTSRDHLAEQEVIVCSNRSSSSGSSKIQKTRTTMSHSEDDDDVIGKFVERKINSHHIHHSHPLHTNYPHTTPPSHTSSSHQHQGEGTFLNSLQTLASSCLRSAAPRPFVVNFDYQLDAGDMATCSSQWTSNFRLSPASTSRDSSNQIEISGINKIAKIEAPGMLREEIVAPKQGPHCDQFLKKLGMAKGEAVEAEEHCCDMTNLNEICYRWQIHCRQIAGIMSRCDPICIEVYLGPENHEILLEQWIILQKEKSNSPSMTLQSLSNAIRSQLYFSQVTAWTDLIKKASTCDRDVFDSIRIKKPTQCKKPHLDILYRIKAYDSTACFNCKPNVHNFPDVVFSDSCAISVCVKSLPRMFGGIPKIDEFLPTCSGYGGAVVPLVGISGISATSKKDEEPSSMLRLCRDDRMMLDDRLNLPCHEKGKHKCSFDDEEVSSDQLVDGSSTSNMSHREKQLLKYRKRMMKRDKKAKKITESDGNISANSSMSSNGSTCRSYQQIQGEDRSVVMDDDRHTDLVSPPQNLQEFASINSIRPPLYQTTTSVAEGVQTNSVEMVSVGTQTVNMPMIFPSCEYCGCEMQFICWNCDKKLLQEPRPDFDEHEIDSCSEQREKLGQGDLLLQAIQRTPKGKIQDSKNNNSYSCRPASKSDTSDCQLCKRQKTQHHYSSILQLSNSKTNTSGSLDHFEQLNGSSVSPSMSIHYLNTPSLVSPALQSPITPTNFHSYNTKNSFSLSSPRCESTESTQLSVDEGDDECDCTGSKRYLPFVYGDAVDGGYDDEIGQTKGYSLQIICDGASSSGSRGINNGSYTGTDRQSIIEQQRKHQKHRQQYRSNQQRDPHQQHGSEVLLKLTDNYDAQFKTPKTYVSNPKNQLNKPSPLYINSSAASSSAADTKLSLLSSTSKLKLIPRINLSNIFSNPSSPIPIAISADDSFSFDSLNNSEIPVQKSNSAPTLPNSPSLSPRFLKQAAIYKRRSRHLSDRSSERSSIGSDEQLSDEEPDNIYSPASSPIKNRIFQRALTFGKRPLIGNLEESLLQKRFTPKSQVGGFKVLLGASGGFCPTQLTIPAAAYFYELKGQSLSTPYVCEIRLSRKGYIIPRTGTVQATLLNPLGTVVRMFVIPYDFRDMPNMSQTFIRQRILAVDLYTDTDENIVVANGDTKMNGVEGCASNGLSSKGNRKFTFGEQMKSLRYAIHLRFQTSRSGRLALHTDIRFLISRRTDCDTAAAHAKGALESPNELQIVTIAPEHPKYSARHENSTKI